MLKAKLKSLKKIFKKKHEPNLHQHTIELTLNEKMHRYILENQNRPLPERETDFRPEILIPCFNHAKYLAQLMAALKDVAVPITVIDDNSSESEKGAIESLRVQYGFKLIRNDVNLRQSGSLNKAIEQSGNNLFIVANADDYLLPGWVDYVVEQFKSTDVFLIGGLHICFFNHFPQSEQYLSRVVKCSGYRQQQQLVFYGPEQAKGFTHDNSIDMTMTGCAFLRSAWAHVGGFYSLKDRVSVHDDRDFQMRVCAFFKVGVSEDISAFWRSDSSTGMGTQ